MSVFLDWDPCNPDPWSVVTWVWADRGSVRIEVEPAMHFEDDATRGLVFEPVEVATLE